MTAMKQEVIDDFKSKLRGRVFQPDDAGYEEARQIWNAMIERRPAMIARCAGSADVMACVAFARDHEVSLAVRGGGHNIAGNALCDGGLVIDLSGMRSVRIDPDRRRAYVAGGATLADFDHEAQAFGLATPLGINSTTGVAGLTLGGGFGWLSRAHGLSVDNLMAADIVIADGRQIHINASEQPDLFWAIRGGGGNFGVVTTFEFQLHPVGPQVTAGLIVFPFAQARQVLTRYRDFVGGIGDDLSVWGVLRKAPPLPFLPVDVHGKEVVVLALFSPLPQERVMPAIDALRGFGQACGEHIGPMPYAAWQQAFDPLLAPGARNYWKSHNFTALSDEAIDTTIGYVAKLPTPQCEIFLGLLGGRVNRVAPDAMAYPHRNVLYAMNVHTRWDDPSEDDLCVAWARDFFAAVAPYAAGSVYINFLTEDEGARIPEAYGQNYERLARTKAKFDPRNLFRQNQNIRPVA
ncbi:MAG: FAD-binding oxidoreductase [Burkholderiaceae bacterium]|nr:FAD-binding oxidoreductase [Burkholderiaceae bacterium]